MDGAKKTATTSASTTHPSRRRQNPARCGPAGDAAPTGSSLTSDLHHVGLRPLVVPGLLVGVPEHPEVADGAGQAADDADQIPGAGPALVDERPSGLVDDLDAAHLLAERLAAAALLEDEVRR